MLTLEVKETPQLVFERMTAPLEGLGGGEGLSPTAARAGSHVVKWKDEFLPLLIDVGRGGL
jgi:hypothetical protein